MAYDIETENGIVSAPVTMVNGRLAFSTRSTTQDHHIAEFTAAGLLNSDGYYQNCTCAEIGPVTLTYTTDAEGGLVPDQVDDRFHANVLLDLSTTNRNQWQLWVMTWLAGDNLTPNSNEAGKSVRGVDLIEMSSINNHRNRIG
jgi:hypothetical protein